jgi:hypothetical protein
MILRPDNSSPENSSLEKEIPGGGKFFVGAFSTLMILCQIILRSKFIFPEAEDSLPE